MTFTDFIHQGLVGYYLSNTEIAKDSVFGIIYITSFVICIIAGYLLGSFNTAIFVSKRLFGSDVRDSGSNNAGMTNMLRTYGGNAAKLTLIGDIAKTFLAYAVGISVHGIRGAYFACFMCMVGHVFPIFHRFRGGKGMVCAATMILCLNPLAFLILIVIFFIIAASMKYVSLASIMCALIYPMAHSWTMGYIPVLFWAGSPMFTVFAALLVLWRHWPNMKRLLERTESKTDLLAALTKKREKKDGEKNNG